MPKGMPIPLDFSMEDYAYPHKNVVYYGFRPFDTLELHRAFSNRGYPFTQDPFPIEFRYVPKEKREYGMVQESVITFNSYFECGNLDMVNRVSDDEYDLFMRVDSNTHGHNQWFYFQATANKTITAKFNMLNFTKKNSLYRYVLV